MYRTPTFAPANIPRYALHVLATFICPLARARRPHNGLVLQKKGLPHVSNFHHPQTYFGSNRSLCLTIWKSSVRKSLLQRIFLMQHWYLFDYSPELSRRFKSGISNARIRNNNSWRYKPAHKFLLFTGLYIDLEFSLRYLPAYPLQDSPVTFQNKLFP